MKCPKCNGICFLPLVFSHNRAKPYIPCIQCDGSGEVPEEMTQWMKVGEILKDKRISKKLTLRDASRQFEGDFLVIAMKLSNMERGVIKPDMTIYDNL